MTQEAIVADEFEPQEDMSADPAAAGGWEELERKDNNKSGCGWAWMTVDEHGGLDQGHVCLIVKPILICEVVPSCISGLEQKIIRFFRTLGANDLYTFILTNLYRLGRATPKAIVYTMP